MSGGACNSVARDAISHQASDSGSLVCWELPDVPVMKPEEIIIIIITLFSDR